MLERCRLFLIIALGETVLTTGVAVAGAPLSLQTVVLGTIALIGIIALWTLSFGRGATLVQHYVEETSDPILAVRLVGNMLTVMVAGLIAIAVANEEVILHPTESGSVVLRTLLIGGPILFLLAGAWYLWVVLRVVPRYRLPGCAALILLGLATVAVPPPVVLGLVVAVLASLAILEQRAGSIAEQ